MKKFKVLTGMLLAAIVASGAVGVGTASAFAQQTAPKEPNRAEISLDDDFDGTSVLVTMTEEVSEINKEYDTSYFDDIAISSIEDLTYMTGDVRNKKYFDESKFKQILKINLPTDSKSNVIEVIDKIERIEGVLSASPNYYENFAKIPNDSSFSSLWGLDSGSGVNAVDAWDITTGSREVKVGVIDTGIANHPDLNANLAEGWDFVNNNNITNDDPTGHGTHVAGIIGACGNNSIGVVGVNWQVTLVPLQVAEWYANKSKWMMNTDATVSAINWAKDNDIPILNYSAGAYEPRDSIKNALESYTGLFVCSAGNGIYDDTLKYNVGVNNDVTPQYPSEYSNESNSAYSKVSDRIISVGSIDRYGNKATSSNYGLDSVSIFAPGESIYSTIPNNQYGYKSGTSMAAPHVAGVAALLLSENSTLLSSQIKDIILNSADDITINVPGGTQNVKKLNAAAALGKLELVGLFGGGTGTSYDPFLIRNETQFRNISKAIQDRYVSSGASVVEIPYHFRLESNITLSGDWTPIETAFAGTLDGNNHSVTYTMNVTQSDLGRDGLGLFELITIGGRVVDLELKNCTITSDINTELTGNGFTTIGILAGAISNAVGLLNVKVTDPKIECNITNMVGTGGIAGGLYGTSVSNCRVTGGSITCYSGALGGMAGYGDLDYFSGGICRTTLTKRNYQDGDKVGPVVGDTESSGSVNTSGITINKEKPCVAKGTLITLADGSQVPVEQLTGNEMLLVWNLQTGTFDAAPILFIDSDSAATYEIINLSFSDGTTVKTIYEHGFWNCDLNEYVYLRSDAAKYIGDWFLKQTADENGNFVSEKVQLIDVSVTQEYTVAYSPVTYSHLCYYVNGMLSMPGGIEGMFNIFEVDAETMKYDEAQMQADIAQYGLFTYEEFAELFPVSEEVFEAFNGQYLKVAMGKGLIDAEGLQALIERYAEFLSAIG